MHTNNTCRITRHQKVHPQKIDQTKLFRTKMTEAEKVLWNQIRAKKLGVKFRRQQIVRGFITDFYCPSLHLAIEVDGAVHNKQKVYDELRTELFSQMGIKTLRFSNDEVLTSIQKVIKTITSYLCETPPQTPPPGGEGLNSGE